MDYEKLISRLEKMVSDASDKHWDKERKVRAEADSRRAQALKDEREEYVVFCERLVKAGAVAGKIPTFAQWQGK